VKNDPRIDPALRAAVDRALGGGVLYSHQAAAIEAALDGHRQRQEPVLLDSGLECSARRGPCCTSRRSTRW